MEKPCADAPDSLDGEYSRLTSAVADRYADIDRLLIQKALADLPAHELDFILSPGASLSSVTARIDYRYGSGSIIPSARVVRNADVFTVTRESEERVYALKKTAGEEQGYRMMRVDLEPRLYAKEGLLKNIGGKAWRGPQLEDPGNIRKIRLIAKKDIADVHAGALTAISFLIT